MFPKNKWTASGRMHFNLPDPSVWTVRSTEDSVGLTVTLTWTGRPDPLAAHISILQRTYTPHSLDHNLCMFYSTSLQ